MLAGCHSVTDGWIRKLAEVTKNEQINKSPTCNTEYLKKFVPSKKDVTYPHFAPKSSISLTSQRDYGVHVRAVKRIISMRI
jgi:hypothetical protein